MADKKKPDYKDMDKATIQKIVVLRFIFTIVLMLAVLFLSAGHLDWWEGWAYGGFTLIVLIVSRVLMLKNDPDIIAERMAAGKEENVKSWDKVFVPVVAIYLPLITWIIVGLDERFGWSPELGVGVQISALIVNLAASMFSSWASYANRFFSSHVRIQTDRGHTVVREGPYQYMRHPGYTGGIISWLTTPLFFSSAWAWIPTLITVAGYIIRTALEDRFLQEELPGYKEYAGEVRYRLFPGIW